MNECTLLGMDGRDGWMAPTHGRCEPTRTARTDHVLVAEEGKPQMQLFQIHFSDELGEWSADPITYSVVEGMNGGGGGGGGGGRNGGGSYSHNNGNGDNDDELAVAALEQFRLRRLLPEHRERALGWDLSEKHARHEVLKIVYDIAEAAVDASLQKGKRRYVHTPHACT